MRSRILPVAAAALCLALTAPLSPELHAQPTTTAQQARVIVKFKSGASVLRKQALTAGETHALRAKGLGERMGLALEGGQGVGERIQVVTGTGLSSEALAARLAQDSEVDYAVPSGRKRIVAAPSDPLYAASGAISPAAGQWYLRAPQAAAAVDSMTVVSSIDAEAAWAINPGSASVVVAVLDTGVRFEHPDLRKVADGGNYLDGYDMISDADIANDGDLRDADASDPGDWIDQADIDSGKFAGACSASDIGSSSWHGTETSALIGAMTNNGIGMASIGRNVRILPVRVLGKCGGNDEDILAGMRWAAGIHIDGVPDNATPAKVINMSLGGSGACSAAYRDAIAEINARGTAVVVSAGNSTGHKVGEPANCAGAIGVSGLRNIGNKVGFSDIGPETSLSAPAGNCVNDAGACLFPILTARNTGAKGPVSSAYSTSTSSPSLGTSFSAPLVAGTAALMFSANPNLTAQQVKLLLQSSARPFPTNGGDPGASQCTAPQYDSNNDPIDQVQCYCNTGVCGAGMLDAGAAVTAATSGTATFVRARIDPSPARALSGQAVTLSGANTNVLAGRTITSYLWTLVDGDGIVTSITNPTARTASVTPSGAGTFTVRLTVTDSAQTSSSATMSIVVAQGPVVVTPPPTPPTPTPTDSGGGGGALSTEWLMALLALIALLRTADRRRT